MENYFYFVSGVAVSGDGTQIIFNREIRVDGKIERYQDVEAIKDLIVADKEDNYEGVIITNFILMRTENE